MDGLRLSLSRLGRHNRPSQASSIKTKTANFSNCVEWRLKSVRLHLHWSKAHTHFHVCIEAAEAAIHAIQEPLPEPFNLYASP